MAFLLLAKRFVRRETTTFFSAERQFGRGHASACPLLSWSVLGCGRPLCGHTREDTLIMSRWFATFSEGAGHAV